MREDDPRRQLSNRELLLHLIERVDHMNQTVNTASTNIAQALQEITDAAGAETTLDASITTFFNGFPAMQAAAIAAALAAGATPAQLASFDQVSATMVANAGTVSAAFAAATAAQAAAVPPVVAATPAQVAAVKSST